MHRLMFHAAATATIVVGLSACPRPARAAEATITVPGTDLVVTGKYTLPADKLGGFIIGIKLPQKNIRAIGCGEAGALLIEMGGNNVIGQPNAVEKALIEKKTQYFEALRKDAASPDLVSIRVKGTRTYLRKSGGHLIFPYCIVIFAGFGE